MAGPPPNKDYKTAPPWLTLPDGKPAFKLPAYDDDDDGSKWRRLALARTRAVGPEWFAARGILPTDDVALERLPPAGQPLTPEAYREMNSDELDAHAATLNWADWRAAVEARTGRSLRVQPRAFSADTPVHPADVLALSHAEAVDRIYALERAMRRPPFVSEGAGWDGDNIEDEDEDEAEDGTQLGPPGAASLHPYEGDAARWPPVDARGPCRCEPVHGSEPLFEYRFFGRGRAVYLSDEETRALNADERAAYEFTLRPASRRSVQSLLADANPGTDDVDRKTLEQTIPVHGPPGTASYASLAAPWRSALVVVRGAGLRPLPPARKRAAAIAKAQANFLSVEAVRRLSARGFEYYLVVLDGDAAAAAGKARRMKEIPCRARGTGAGAGPAGTRWVPVPLSPKDAAKFPTAAEQKDLCYWLGADDQEYRELIEDMAAVQDDSGLTGLLKSTSPFASSDAGGSPTVGPSTTAGPRTRSASTGASSRSPSPLSVSSTAPSSSSASVSYAEASSGSSAMGGDGDLQLGETSSSARRAGSVSPTASGSSLDSASESEVSIGTRRSNKGKEKATESPFSESPASSISQPSRKGKEKATEQDDSVEPFDWTAFNQLTQGSAAATISPAARALARTAFEHDNFPSVERSLRELLAQHHAAQRAHAIALQRREAALGEWDAASSRLTDALELAAARMNTLRQTAGEDAVDYEMNALLEAARRDLDFPDWPRVPEGPFSTPPEEQPTQPARERATTPAPASSVLAWTSRVLSAFNPFSSTRSSPSPEVDSVPERSPSPSSSVNSARAVSPSSTVRDQTPEPSPSPERSPSPEPVANAGLVIRSALRGSTNVIVEDGAQVARRATTRRRVARAMVTEREQHIEPLGGREGRSAEWLQERREGKRAQQNAGEVKAAAPAMTRSTKRLREQDADGDEREGGSAGKQARARR